MNNLDLLKEEAAFQKLFLLFKKKYESIGQVGGSVSIKHFSEEEVEVICGLIGFSEAVERKKQVSLPKFEEALQQTIYRDYTLVDILEAFFGEPLVSSKEQKAWAEKEEAAFVEQLKATYPAIGWYVKRLSEKTPDTRFFWRLYRTHKADIPGWLHSLEQAFLFTQTNDSLLRLPLFSQQITGNPHSFDRNELLGKWLLHLLTVHQHTTGSAVSFARTTEEENELLGMYGLLRDDLWSFVTIQQLIAEKQGVVHPVWQAAHQWQTVLNIPLKELLTVTRIYPAVGNKVWAVENSSVASTLMDAVPQAPIVCTHGQLRLSGWKLIEHLAASGTTVCYAGDLDPEGLLIADRLKSKYPAHIELWRMDEHTYTEHLSDEVIPEDRLAKLQHIQTESLVPLVKAMRLYKKAMYQEAVVDVMIRDITAKITPQSPPPSQ